MNRENREQIKKIQAMYALQNTKQTGKWEEMWIALCIIIRKLVEMVYPSLYPNLSVNKQWRGISKAHIRAVNRITTGTYGTFYKWNYTKVVIRSIGNSI